jgi:F0F1-type ATP synthase membrane subunit b/b'
MENGLLREIIGAEKEIQQSIEQADQAVRAWIEARKQELNERLAIEEKEIADSFKQAREKLAREAADRANDLVVREQQRAGRLDQLDNNVLARIVADRIRTILPGEP